MSYLELPTDDDRTDDDRLDVLSLPGIDSWRQTRSSERDARTDGDWSAVFATQEK